MDGKITIDYEGLKREFERPFRLCLGRQDLFALLSALEKQTQGQDEFVYGWIDVPLLAAVIPNQKPKGWDE